MVKGGESVEGRGGDVTLILRDQDVQGLLPMAKCIAAMELAFADYANGLAANRPLPL